jgi:hypothetical protein
MDVVPETDPWMRRRSLPAGRERLFLPQRDGWPVRLEHWPRRNPERGHMLMGTSRADFVEKYAEALHDLVRRARHHAEQNLARSRRSGPEEHGRWRQLFDQTFL